MKSKLSILFIVMFTLACGNSKTESSNASENTQPAVSTVNPTQTQTIDPVNNVTGNSTGLNPAHGEPGHRCDIPVGSPLNSKPAEQPESKNTQPAQPTVISPSPTTVEPAGKTTTASGLNPAHGEPGHRCDIPVGSPLNSKPAQTTGTQSTFIPPAMPKKAN
jgi:hypothetical protein